ncbi:MULTISPECIES: LysR family transcriptional regulator [Burkholderia cepacia complex]|uniref:LysR substrate-binding domain-containing protein n=1 Tax=Burkholderia cepacia complex TaxID=87882 RepID=UPI001CF5E173|nr:MULTISPECIES: LysR family transcriptional regulator [Burkholderia cepacia complex]MCA8057369.1 LysR family transcriptional regulator [Burkholderia cepacia]MDN7535194.1 LysR family transcriptional regulator [Burkholderia orbicola]
MEIKALRCFLHVAETLSFHRASERLAMSQPVVTRTIGHLEDQFGVKLFTRTTRRVALTPAGALLVGMARSLIAQADQVRRDMRHAGNSSALSLRIGCTPTALTSVAAPMVRAFRNAYPEVDLSLSELASGAQLDGLLSADLDVGFALAPINNEALASRTVHREKLRLVIPADHAYARRDCPALPLKAFAGDAFIVPSRRLNGAVHDEVIRGCASAGFRPRLIECEQDQGCIGRVSAGLGVLFIGRQAGCVFPADVRIVDIEPAPVFEVVMVWRADDPSVPVINFIRLAPSMDSSHAAPDAVEVV